MSLAVIILAAGRGVRMKGTLPKVLHCLAGVPILSRVVSTVRSLNPDKIVIVYGQEGERLKTALPESDLEWVEQAIPLGTGHAALQAIPLLVGIKRVLILYGDIPLIKSQTLQALLAQTPSEAVGMITAKMSNPTGFGRIIRDNQQKISEIVEEKDATLAEKTITEINTGFFVGPKETLEKWLPLLQAQNRQQEYYLTDIIKMAYQSGLPIQSVSPTEAWEVAGINDKVQLSELERTFQKARAEEWMREGLMLRDPARLDVRGEVIWGADVIVDVNVILEGKIQIGKNVKIGPNVYIKDTVIEEGAEIFSNSVIEGAHIGEGCQVGPFARIRPGTSLQKKSKIGNFVEIKNASIGEKTKINHLSYVGDAVVGSETNIGAGTITCNYDGYKKHKTWIGNQVFVGSNSQLIAPLTIADGVTIAAGTVVRKSVASGSLVHNRLEQKVIENWKKKSKPEDSVKEGI